MSLFFYISRMNELWLVSVPGEQYSNLDKIPADVGHIKSDFRLPELKVGTLDTLIQLRFVLKVKPLTSTGVQKIVVNNFAVVVIILIFFLKSQKFINVLHQIQNFDSDFSDDLNKADTFGESTCRKVASYMIDILDGDQAQAVENLKMENGRSSPSGKHSFILKIL